MKTIISIILLIAGVIGCNTSSREKIPEDDSLQYYPPTPQKLDQQEFRQYYRQLNDLFDTTLLNKGFNGGIVVAKNGTIIYEKYSGQIDLRKTDLNAGQADSLTDSTSLHIASTSKTFTGIAILRLVEEGKLSLTDSLSKFFPGFPYPGITVKMLLTHRSGLPNYVYFISNSKWDKKKYATNEDMLNIMFTEKPDKSFSPDTRFSYSNTNYVLLAMIIEKVSGTTFPVYMQQKFFAPLQMKHTYVFTLKDTLTATPSFTNNNVYWDYDFLDATYGDKNIYSTPQDLLKWDQALYTDQIISPALLDSAFTPYSHERPTIHNYGLGWRLQMLPNGKKIVYHFGRWHGFNAAFTRLMDEKVTIIILGNKFTRNIYWAAHLCYDIFGEYNQRNVKDDDDDDSPESVKKTTNLFRDNKKSENVLLPGNDKPK